jgi:mycothiol synthase
MDDLPAALVLLNACEIAETGQAEYTLDDLGAEWEELDLAHNAWLILAPEGPVVASVTLNDRGHGRIDTDGYVHPEYRGRGLGAALIHLAEARARELVADAPPGARVALTNTVSARDQAGRALLEQQGYTPSRHFWRMTITMDAPPPPPAWPAGITVRPFVAEQDEPAVHAAQVEAFSDHWGTVPEAFDAWVQRHLAHPYFDPAVSWVARAGDSVVGSSINRLYPDLGWIDAIGVRRAWRGRGLGLALLLQSMGEFYRRGQPKMDLMVDAQSLTGATRLYERVGMRVSEQYDRYEKELRSGLDLSTRAIQD